MKRTLIRAMLAVLLVAGCFADNYVLPDGTIVFCTTCCDSYGNCYTTCF